MNAVLKRVLPVAPLAIAAGFLVGAPADAGSSTPATHVAAVNACTVAETGMARITYQVSTYSIANGWQNTQDRGYVARVFKQDTMNSNKWFAVPSTSGGENARMVAASYSQTGTGNWRVQYKNGNVQFLSTAAHVNGTC